MPGGITGGGGIANWLFGGDATNAIDPNLAHGAYTGGYLQNQLNTVGQRQAPMAGAAQLAGGPQADARAQMGGVTGQLQRIMSGQQTGAGELAVNRQIGQATAAQQAAARAARGANAALAARLAARNTADIGVAGAGQAAQAQLQDQQGATSQLGQLLGNMRAQDIGFAGQNAQFQQQTGLANQGAQLQQTGMNDQARLGYLGQLLGLDQAQMQALLAKQQLGLQDQGHIGALLQGAGQIGAAAAGVK